MKLHLPKTLRAAVLACIAAVGGVTTTVGTGFVAGGVLTIAFAGSAALAVTSSTTQSWDDPDSWTAGEALVVDSASTLTLSGDWGNTDRGECNVSVSAGSTLVVDMDDDSVLKVRYLNIHDGGGNAADTMTVKNGTVIVTDTNDVARIGHWGGNATHALNIEGGTLAATNGTLKVAWDSKGALSVSNTGKLVTKGINLGAWWNYNGALSISGGTTCLGTDGITSTNRGNVGNAFTWSGGTVATYADTLTISGNVGTVVTGAVKLDTTKYTLGTDGYTVTAGKTGAVVNVNGALTIESSGALTIEGAGSVNIGGTLQNDGKIVVNSAVNLNPDSGVTAPLSTNGMIGGAQYTLFAGSGTIELGSKGKWMVDGTEITGTLNGNVLEAEALPIYVLVDADVSNTDEATKDADGYMMQGAGLTLTLTGARDSDLPLGIEVQGDDSTVVLGSGTSLTDDVFSRSSGSLNLTVEDGATFTSDYSGGAPAYNGQITILGGGTVALGANDGLGWGGSATGKIVMEGTEGNDAVLSIGARQTCSTAIEMKGNATINSGGKTLAPDADTGYETVPGLDMYSNSSITVSGTNNEIGVNIYGRDGSPDPVTITVEEGGELEVSGAIVQRAGGPTNFAKAGAGLLTLSSDDTAINGLFSNLAGTTEVTGDATFNGGLDIAAGSSLILGAKSTAITLGGPIMNAGSLVIKGTVNIADVSKLTLLPSGYTDGVNGFEIVAGYSLIEGEGTVDLTEATVMYEGKKITLAYADGAYSFAPADAEVGTDYFLNSGDLVLDGTNAEIEAATGYILAENTNLILKTGSAVNPLLNSSGAGNIVLDASVALPGDAVTEVTGSLTIGSGATLTIGNGDRQASSISSFSSIIFDGGTIYFDNMEDTLNNITVTEKGGTYTAHDMGSGVVTMAGTTQLVGDFTIAAKWNTQIDIDNLAGAGNLTATQGDEAFRLKINNAEDYKGTLSARNMQLVFGEDLTVFGGGLTVNGGSQRIESGNLTIKGAVVLENTNLAPWEASGPDGSTITFAGSVSGGGNFITNIKDATYTFAGDTSNWKPGNVRALADTTFVFSGTSTINGNNMRAEGGNTLNLVIDNANAVTVSGSVGTVDSPLVISVRKAGAVSFTGTLITGGTITGNGGDLTIADLNLTPNAALDVEALDSSQLNGFIAVKKLIATGFGTINAPADAGNVTAAIINADGQLYFTEDASDVYQITTEVDFFNDVAEADQLQASSYAVAKGATLIMNNTMTKSVDITNNGTVKLAGSVGMASMSKVTNGGDVYISTDDGSKNLIQIEGPTYGVEMKTITVDGNVVKVGASKGSYKGALTILDGATLQYTYEQLSATAGGVGEPSHITVEKGGTLDMHSNYAGYGITLNGGTLASSSAKADQTQHPNLPTFNVTADSTVDLSGGGVMHIIGSGYVTPIGLNGHTLTKTGSGTLNMFSPTINGGGKFVVAEGTLEWMGQSAGKPNAVANDVTVEVAENATFIAGNNIAVSLDNITGDGTVWLRNGRTINLQKGVTDIATIQAGGGASHVVYMNLADEATLKVPANVTQGELRINGTGTFDLGSSFVVPEKIRMGADWNGVAKVVDAVVESTDVIDTAPLTPNKSSLAISGLTMKKGGSLTVGGLVAMDGTLTLADSITSSSAKVSFGEAASIDLVGLDSTVNEAGEIVFRVFDGDAVDLTALTESNLSEATLAMGGTSSALVRAGSGWIFGTDGTISLAAMTQEWLDTAGDDSMAGSNWTAGSTLRDGASLLFAGKGTGDVTVDKTATVKNVSVTAGDYNITSNGTDTLTIGGDVTISGGKLTMADGLSMGGSYNQTGGTLDTTSLTSGGDISITGATVQNSTGTEALVISGATIGQSTLSNVELTDSTINGKLTTAGDLTLNGTITVDKTGFDAADIDDTTVYAPGNSTDAGSMTSSGFATSAYVAQLVDGSLTEGETLTWADADTPGAIISYDDTTGKLTVEGTVQGDRYYVNADGETVYSTGTLAQFTNKSGVGATAIILHGGSLELSDGAWNNSMQDGIIADYEGTSIVELGETATLNKSKLSADATNKAALAGSGTYNLENSADLGTGVSLDSAWTGTVATGDVTADALDITGLSNDNSSVKMGAVTANSLVSGTAADITATGDVLLASGAASSVAGDLTTQKELTLGTATTSATLTVAGTLDAQQGITLANAASSLSVGALAGDVIDIKADGEALAGLNEADGGTVILTSSTEFTGETWLNGATPAPEYGAKYFSTLTWTENATEAAAPSYDLVFDAVANENWLKETLAAEGGNAVAGGALLDEVFASSEPQKNAPDSDFAKLLDSMDAFIAAGDSAGAADLAASAAGASIAATGAAFAGDVERQMRSIRNRTTTMGVNQYVINEDMPYFNAWINAEGNHNELDGSGTKSGYKLDNWGGTVGMDIDFNPSLTAGLAVSAMYGDFTADGPGSLEGDIDTCYVSAFARIADSAWTHTFVGTIGKADMSLSRTVSHALGSYETTGDTEGMAFGLMYELGYVIPLAEDGSTCLQPIFNVAYRHTSVDSYTEKGGEAALDVDSQAYNTITLGAGARLQTIIGENLYNRASMLELRALVKVDAGDRCGEVETMFIDGNAKGKVKSEELGAVGIELGAGLNIPLGSQSGTLFIDGGVEFRSGYTNVNGTVGWRINF